MLPYSIANHCMTLGVQYLGNEAVRNYLVILAFFIHPLEAFPIYSILFYFLLRFSWKRSLWCWVSRVFPQADVLFVLSLTASPAASEDQLLVKMVITAKSSAPFPLSWIVAAWILFQLIGQFIKNRIHSKKERWFLYRIALNCEQELDWPTDHPERTANTFSLFLLCHVQFHKAVHASLSVFSSFFLLCTFVCIICQSNSKTQQNHWKLSALCGLMSFLK